MSDHNSMHGASVSRRAYLRDAALIYFSQAVAAAFPLLISPFVVRLRGLDTFGEYALLLLGAQVACLVSEYSFDVVGPRLLAMNESADAANLSHASRTFAHVFCAKLLLAPLAVTAATVSTYFVLKRGLDLVEMAAVFMIIMGTAMQSSWFLVGTGQATVLATSSAVGRIFSLILIGVLVSIGGGEATELLMATAVGVLTTGGLAVVRNRRIGPQRIEWKFSLSLLGRGAAAFAGVTGSALQNLVGQAATGIGVGVAGAGVYSAIDRLARGVSACIRPLFMALYPRMAALYVCDVRSARRVLARALIAWFIFASVCVSIGIYFGEVVIVFIYGSAMADAGNVLIALVGWLCVGTLNNLLGIQGLLAAGKDKVYAVGMWLGLISTLAFTVALLSYERSTDSVARAVLLGEVVIAVLFIYQYRQERLCS